MPLQSGTYAFDGNGFTGQLVIGSVDSSGNLTNSTVYGENIFGFWDETAKKITFARKVNPNDFTSFQVYEGYQYLQSPNILAGSFVAFSGTGASAQRNMCGWHAIL